MNDRITSSILTKTLQTATSLVCRMPYPLALSTAKILGAAAWILDPLHRRIARMQMKSALHMKNTLIPSLKVFMNHGVIIIDALRYARMSDEEISREIDITGKENLEEALAAGRGIMFIEGHVGNWEMTMHIPRLTGINFGLMVDERKNSALQSFISSVRSQKGITLLPPKGGMIKSLVAELEQKRHIFIAIDMKGARAFNIRCELFGMPAITNPAPAYIALKSGALIMPVSILKKNGRYNLHFDKAIDAGSFGDKSSAGRFRDCATNPYVHELSSRMQGWLEGVVREKPIQWIWLYSRWIRRSEIRRLIRRKGSLHEYIISQE